MLVAVLDEAANALNVGNRCPLSCRQWGGKRTRYTHCEFFAVWLEADLAWEGPDFV